MISCCGSREEERLLSSLWITADEEDGFLGWNPGKKKKKKYKNNRKYEGKKWRNGDLLLNTVYLYAFSFPSNGTSSQA